MKVSLLIFTALILMACPSYDDHFSGTYREDTSLTTFSGEARTIELFRFGDNVQALVRYYKRGSDPFEREARCEWTKAATFSEDGFSLPLLSTRSRINIKAQFLSEDRLSFSFDGADGAFSKPAPFQRFSDTPDKKCTTIDDTLISANFDFAANRFEPGVFELNNPVFVLMWLGVDVIQKDTLFTFAKTQKKGPWVRIGKSHTTQDQQGLKGVLHFFLPPPDISVLTASGDTRFSIGHPIVVEDEEGDTGNFTLEIGDEKVIASAIKNGTRPGISPEGSDNFGRAIFFVEGALDDLSDALQRQFRNVKEVDVNQHFYVVEIYSRGEEIKEIRFDPNNDVELNILITEAYLNHSELVLPRLVPLRL